MHLVKFESFPDIVCHIYYILNVTVFFVNKDKDMCKKNYATGSCRTSGVGLTISTTLFG